MQPTKVAEGRCLYEHGGVASCCCLPASLPAVINDVSKINDYASLFVSAEEVEKETEVGQNNKLIYLHGSLAQAAASLAAISCSSACQTVIGARNSSLSLSLSRINCLYNL